MPDNVYKTIEITGSSSEGIDDAVRGAIARAAQTVREIEWFEVTEIRGHVSGDQVEHVQVTLKVGFRLQDAGETS